MPKRLDAWIAELNTLSLGDRRAALAALAERDAELAAELAALSGDKTQADVPPAAIEPQSMPTQIGEYSIRQILGRGGMGVVYLAERPIAGTVQRVALKVLGDAMLSPRAVSHFFAERRILAGLGHPNIATLIEAGTAPDGTPFLAMEYVQGQTLDDYCRSRSERERLVLLQGVLAAVAFAHRNLVVHRDLKPSNILVTDSGTPKLLDFGIAKLLDEGASQATQSRLYTPDYASPEQLSGEAVTTASDIYALGIVLHEILTGRKPAREGFARTVDRSLPPGLRRIVDKMLEPDPARRYHSAAAVGDDLAAHLAGSPLVHAHETRGERVRKFVRRHRVGVTLATSALIAAAAILGLSLYGARQLAIERDRALAAEQSSQQVVEFLIGVFDQADPNTAAGREITARDVLDTAVLKVDTLASADPAAQAQLYRALAEICGKLGMQQRDLELSEKALAVYRQLDPPQAAAQFAAMRDLILDRNELGQLAEADALLTETERFLSEHRLGDRERMLLALTRSELYSRRGNVEAAIAEAEGALGMFGDGLSKNSIEYASALQARAGLWMDVGMPGKALPLRAQELALRRELQGEDHTQTLHTLAQYGRTLRESGDAPGALRELEEALSRRLRILGPMHPEVAMSANEIANVYHDIGDVANAERYYRQSIAVARNEATYDPMGIAQTSNNLAILLEQAGRFEEAEPLYRESIALRRRYAGEDTPRLIRAEHNLGVFLSKLGRFDEAVALLERSYSARLQLLGENHIDTKISAANLGFARYLATPTAELGRASRDSFRAAIDALGDQPALRTQYQLRLAQLLLALADPVGAATEARAALAAIGEPDSINAAVAELTLGVALAQQGDPASADLIAKAKPRALPTLAPTSPLRSALANLR